MIAHALKLDLHQNYRRFFEQIAHAAGKVLTMVVSAIDALVNRDAGVARMVRQQDKEVDQLCKECLADLMDDMQNDPATVRRAVHAFNTIRNLERIADLATNIAKDVIFLVEGQIVRHGGRMPER